MTDGLDGLAIGCTLIAAAAFTVLAYVTGHRVFSDYLDVLFLPRAGEVTVFCGAMVGASMGFLWWNCYPAQIFMGDVGSLSLGGALGTVAILIKQELLLITIGGVFVLEALSVILQVASFKLRGQAHLPHGAAAPPFRADRLGGAADHHPLPDHRLRLRAVHGHHAEAEMRAAEQPMQLASDEDALELAGKSVVVVGLARSGVAAAEFLARRGARVVATDRKPEGELAQEALNLRGRACG